MNDRQFIVERAEGMDPIAAVVVDEIPERDMGAVMADLGEHSPGFHLRATGPGAGVISANSPTISVLSRVDPKSFSACG